jgi:hypothetical protein
LKFLKRIAYLFAFLISFQAYVLSLNTRPCQKIITLSQKDTIIAYSQYFTVLDDECFLINDMKDNKIMLYDQDGKLLKSWQAVGQGPGEYQGMWMNDYSKPYMGVFDARVQKLLLFRRVGILEFQWIEDIFSESQNVKNFKLDKDKIVFDGPVFYKNRYYFIQIRNLKNKKDEYCLPAEARYGKKPGADYKKPDAEFRRLWGPPWSYLDVFDGHVYSAWIGMLNVIKIDITTKEYTSFGQITKNYSQPKVWKVSMADLKRASQWNKENKPKFSWVTGIFADRDLVGLIYTNYNPKKSCWEPILQHYDGEGVFLKEEKLAGAQDTSPRLRYDYSRDMGCLYVLNMTEFDSGEVEFKILKYQIRQ